jgi:hypothetical protein
VKEQSCESERTAKCEYALVLNNLCSFQIAPSIPICPACMQTQKYREQAAQFKTAK